MFEKSFLRFAHFTLRYILQKVFFIPKYAREAASGRFYVYILWKNKKRINFEQNID